MTTAQIEQSEVRDAAEAMLAALKRAEIGALELCHDQDPANECWNTLEAIRAAIRQAESVGIRVKD